MTTIIIFILVLGVLIFIHELGHFAVAKWAGVGVEQFSLGFGPKLFGFTRGETEYKVSLLPLGGFVKMTGEGMNEDVSDEDKEKSFMHKPLSKRIAIVAAGPIMNLVLAVVLLPITYMIGVTVPAFLERAPVVGIVAPGEAGERAGLKSGDMITEINGDPIEDWEDLIMKVALSPERELKLKVNRGGMLIDKTLTPEPSKNGAGIGGFSPFIVPRVGGLTEGSPAEAAGIEAEDIIVQIDDRPIVDWSELQSAVKASEGNSLRFVVERRGSRMSFDIAPKLNEASGGYLIGVVLSPDKVFKRYGFFSSISHGVGKSLELSSLLFTTLKGLVIGDYSLKTLGGPIMIAKVAGKAAENGFSELLTFVAFLSLQLGIINLFPIPVLDGGHLFFFGIEGITRKQLNERFIAITQQVGLVLLLLLMVVVTWNDIMRTEFIGKLTSFIGF